MSQTPAGTAHIRPIDRAVTLLWERIPTLMARVSLTLSVALSDGAYVRAWPYAAVGLPVGASVLGVALGVLHPGGVYSYSTVVLALLVAVSGVGAAAGTYAFTGYVIADLIADNRSALPGF